VSGVLEGLAVGADIVVSDTQQRIHHRKVAKVGRVWLTDNIGDRFRIDTGGGEHRFGHGSRAMTPDVYAEEQEDARARAVLVRWQMVPTGGRRLTRDQLHRVADLLAGFERVRELPEGLRDHGFARSGCLQIEGEDLFDARRRGSAAEAAADAAEMIRQGRPDEAASLLDSAKSYLTGLHGPWRET
jgi:hypothetical protein